MFEITLIQMKTPNLLDLRTAGEHQPWRLCSRHVTNNISRCKYSCNVLRKNTTKVFLANAAYKITTEWLNFPKKLIKAQATSDLLFMTNIISCLKKIQGKWCWIYWKGRNLKRKIPGGVWSRQSYILTYSRLDRGAVPRMWREKRLTPDRSIVIRIWRILTGFWYRNYGGFSPRGRKNSGFPNGVKNSQQ